MSVNVLLRTLVDEMAAADVPDPLAQPCTLALVWADLARLAGESVPAEVAALLDAPIPCARCAPRPSPAATTPPTEKLSDKGPENGLLPHVPSATLVRTLEDNERCGETATLPPSRHPLSDSF